MKTLRTIALLSVGLLAAGCDAPKVERGAELARFQKELAQRTAAQGVKPATVLTLAQCEQIALRNSLALSVQRLTLQLADDQVRLALAGGLPKAVASYRYTGRSNAPLMNQGGVTVPMDDRHQQAFAMEATVPVLDWGLTYYAWQIARDQRTQEQLLYRRSEQLLRRDVRVAYAKYAGALRQYQVAGVNIQAAEEMLKMAVTQEREGLATPAETAIFRAAVAIAKAEQAAVAQRIDESRLALCELMSLPPGIAFQIDPALDTLPAAPDAATIARLETHALRVRPELAVQDLARHVSANAVRQRVATFLPRVDGLLSVNWTSSSMMLNPAYAVLGTQVTQTLLDGGKRIWEYDIARKTMTIEEEQTLLLSLGVLYDVDLRAVQLVRGRETVAALEVSEKARREAFDRIMSLYREGLENVAGTAKALADLNVELLAVDRARTDYMVNWAEFEAATLPYEPDPAAPATRAAATQAVATTQDKSTGAATTQAGSQPAR